MPISKSLIILFLITTMVSAALGIKCWQCGQYSDGVGSITPCANQSAAKLAECPKAAKYCIKYVSELTTVRDCVPTCSEREWWGARTFCCDTDECNAATSRNPLELLLVFSILLICLAH